MKLYEIKAVARYLKQFDFIKKARRVANNVIELNFGHEWSIFFDLTRGNATIYKAPTKPFGAFNAPFDLQLHANLSHAKILDISVPQNDKVIIFKVKPKSQYKEQITYARFELTGRYTNLILTDSENRVIEALHHIDSSKSYREVRPGVLLKELLPFKSNFEGEVEDVEALLENNYQRVYSAELKRVRQQKLNIIRKKLQRVERALNALPDKEKLAKQSEKYSSYANIILANLHTITHIRF